MLLFFVYEIQEDKGCDNVVGVLKTDPSKNFQETPQF